ncbi:response regulator [Streptomyces sp. NPDC057592]|uniref:response regulator n=1 Tax=unclassified Streptomyces TaxID=2593676 RepID=UPI0036C51BD0
MRVVITEDNVLLSSGLELLLNSQGFEVVAIAADAPGFLTAVETHRPDVTIVDVRLPRPSATAQGRRILVREREDYFRLWPPTQSARLGSPSRAPA